MKQVCMALCSVALLAIGLVAAEEKEEKFSAKCPVSGKDAVETATGEYRGATVYFCCEGCPDAFTADTKKYAAAANAQLVQTEQATQIKCPFTGGKLNKDTAIKVGEVEVAFCCNNCKGKASEKSGAEQVALVFNDTAFDKGFEVKKAEKEE
jgi:YHS domain-containing protein